MYLPFSDPILFLEITLSVSVKMNPEVTRYAEYKAAQSIWKIVSPILLVLGTLGNILSIIVLCRKNVRKSTTSVYLTVLAISDIMFLYSGLLRQWILATFDVDIRKTSEFVCKVNFFLVYYFADLSAWLLTALTFERVVLVWNPHRGKIVCSRVSAATVVGVILISLLLFNGHLLFGNGISHELQGNVTVTKECTRIGEEYNDFFIRIWPWIDLAKFCIGPFLLLLIGNSLIVIKIVWNRKKLSSRVGPTLEAVSSAQKKSSSATALLFTLNAVYFITATPISVYLIQFDGWADPTDFQGVATDRLLWVLCNVLMYANNTFNFVLYCLSGRRFRHEVKRLFCVQK